jgi:hypothetical protein
MSTTQTLTIVGLVVAVGAAVHYYTAFAQVAHIAKKLTDENILLEGQVAKLQGRPAPAPPPHLVRGAAPGP